MEDLKNKMKAAVLYGPSDVRIEEVDVPDLKNDEVLVALKAIGICPSDVRIYEGIYKRKLEYGEGSYGLSGHELSGEVVRSGSSVKDFSPGDRVVHEVIVPCGNCKFCKGQRSNLCTNKEYVMRGYAEYVKIPSKQLFRIPSNVSYEAAAFVEPIMVCLHANEMIAPARGDAVLIIGGGPMGLMHVQISKMSGTSVILSDRHERRLRAAKELGADTVINPSEEDLPKIVKESTVGHGADVVIVATGNKAAIETAFKNVSVAGTIALFAGTYPPATVEIDPNMIHYGEIRVVGSHDHLAKYMQTALKLLSEGSIETEKMISHTFGLNQLREGFELVKSHEALKVNIKPYL